MKRLRTDRRPAAHGVYPPGPSFTGPAAGRVAHGGTGGASRLGAAKGVSMAGMRSERRHQRALERKRRKRQ